LSISAIDAIRPALEHTRQQLLKPFQIGQWTKLAFVGLLAGELGGKGFNTSNFQFHHPGPSGHISFPGSLGIDHALLIALIAAVTVAGIAIGIILMYVGSVMRFILFDSIVAKRCYIRWSWSQRLAPGWRYFVWRLLYLFLTLIAVGVLIGVPLLFAFTAGWLKQPKEHLPVLVFGGVVLSMALITFFVATLVVLVLTKDFVVPQMALENIDASEGWRRLLRMMAAEKGAYAAYIGMKIVLAFAASILIGIATLILGLIIAIPSIGLGILAFVTGKTAGLTWNPRTIALAAVIAVILLAIFFYLVSLISVPAIVFFPAYSVYFFAGRYPRLNAVLYAAQPVPRVSSP
jgi:hypothetical protein